jgi:hypothetical protein
MEVVRHAELMELLLLLTFLIGPLALFLGADSRLDERSRWPEWRRM